MIKVLKERGPVGKFFSENSLKEIMKICNAKVGDSIFLACGNQKEINKILSIARDKIAKDLIIINTNQHAFCCWIVDYPMFEFNETQKKLNLVIILFQCPKENWRNINFKNPLEIKALQYDIVCDGVELSSGAIRNHVPELMYKLFSIAGYKKKMLMKNLVV